ncbi:MAG: phenylalanine--tRNA ligase subunit beta [Clostridia bacterium]|nr:phenylalanine--tRNA ligase subunit beta [Clostridia bacterium]
MKLSLEWLSDFVPCDGIAPKEYCDRMTATGSKVEGFEILGEDIVNVKTAKILSLVRHENSDHLWVCQADVGGGVTKQIVTGAQNLFEGAVVPAALAPATLPGGIAIKTGKLRGVESEGMFCSIAELGLTTHEMPGAAEDGILILDPSTPVGVDIREALRLSDVVVDFEITSNRPDCLSVIGLARETAASFGRTLSVKKPAFRAGKEKTGDFLSVQIADPDLCPRYTARVVRNVKIAPSPLWMRMRLRASGVRPINNIVDITNYVMLEYGQPMHAFDYRCLEGSAITVRRAAEGESFRSLDGKDHLLSSSMLVIADAKKPVALAGVMGGENSEITDETTTVVFESANFRGGSVRRAAKALGMRTESSSRFEKGLCAENCLPALDRACELVALLGAGEIADGTIDAFPGKKDPTVLPLEPEKINRFLGTDIPGAEMERILRSLDFTVKNGKITVPSFRGDVGCMNDVAEEVVRIWGYEAIRSTPLRGETTRGGLTDRQKFRRAVSDRLAALGYFEAVTFSFISPKFYDRIRLPEDSPLRRSVKIRNPLGEDTGIMRTTALPSLLDVLLRNRSRGADAAAIFELASVYLPKEDENELPDERVSLVLGFYGDGDFYRLKSAVCELFSLARAGEPDFAALTDSPTFHPGRAATVSAGERAIGTLGELHPAVAAGFGFPAETRVYAAELDLDALFSLRGGIPQFTPLPKFPSSTRDFSFVCGEELEVGAIERALRAAGEKLLCGVRLFDVYRGAQLGENKKSVSFRVWLRAADRTITDEEADKAVSKLLSYLEKTLGITLR